MGCMKGFLCAGSACKDPLTLNYNTSGYICLTNTTSGVYIDKKSSSQMNPVTFWTITMAIHTSDVTEWNTFSWIISSNVTPDESLALWSWTLLSVIRDPIYSEFRGLPSGLAAWFHRYLGAGGMKVVISVILSQD